MSVTPEDAGSPSPPDRILALSDRIARAAPLARPERRISRNAVAAIVAGFVVLGGAGGFVENYLNARTAGPSPAASTPTTAPQGLQAGRLHRGTAALLALTATDEPAPGFRLTDQHGRPVGLGTLEGKAAVLSFFDATCNDLCPVVATELRDADRALGRRRDAVTFVTINTDPLAIGHAAAVEAAGRSRLGGPGGIPGWRFLTGSLGALDRTWRQYGITVDVQRTTGRVVHTDLIAFVTPTGRLAYEATPFATRDGTGRFRLSSAVEARFGNGIARVALRLAKPVEPSR